MVGGGGNVGVGGRKEGRFLGNSCPCLEKVQSEEEGEEKEKEKRIEVVLLRCSSKLVVRVRGKNYPREGRALLLVLLEGRKGCGGRGRGKIRNNL